MGRDLDSDRMFFYVTFFMLGVRCVVRTAFSLDWTGILDSPDKFKTHRIPHA